ncbi:hypothetical protein [Largemouth bass virus]
MRMLCNVIVILTISAIAFYISLMYGDDDWDDFDEGTVSASKTAADFRQNDAYADKRSKGRRKGANDAEPVASIPDARPTEAERRTRGDSFR